MTGDRPRRRRRRRTKARQSSTSTAVTHISSLGTDLVLEIFVRLSSLATLVRAALTCRAWRHAVASCPDFGLRFRALHPAPPLLGIFFGSALYQPPRSPSFVPGGFRDWDLAGAVRGGDLFLTSLLERYTESSHSHWQILDCRGGRILITDAHDFDNPPLIVLNPMMRSRVVHEFRYPPGPRQCHTPRFICQLLSSFRVVLLGYGRSRLQPSVYSLDTGKWSALPDVDFPARKSGESGKKIWIKDEFKMHGNEFVYWSYWRNNDERMYLISLDTTTMEFSFAELPQCLKSPLMCFTFQGGEAEDGAACIVYSDGSNMFGVVKHTRGDDGVDRWVPHRVLELDGELERLHVRNPSWWHKLSIVAVRDGYVYFATSPMEDNPEIPCCWFMSLCLATGEVEKLFERRYDSDANVYIMPWPPCLLASNYGQFASGGTP